MKLRTLGTGDTDEFLLLAGDGVRAGGVLESRIGPDSDPAKENQRNDEAYHVRGDRSTIDAPAREGCYSSLMIGTTLGRHRIVEALGRGGMGRISSPRI